MKRSELKDWGVPEEAIDKIMQANGADIENVKSQFKDYEEVKAKLNNAEKTLEGFKDYDNVKAEVEKYKAENKKIQDESAAKIARMEREGKIREFTSSKKFVNDFTRDSINAAIFQEMDKEESKGKSFEELLKLVTDGKENIFVDDKKPTPPNVPPMGNPDPKSEIAERNAVREVMGLPPLKD